MKLLIRLSKKLWIHRGASIDPEENIGIGTAQWESTYREQRKYKEQQVFQMIDFAQLSKCRMLSLVKHFGDQNDSGDPCRICDICNPSQAYSFQSKRHLSEKEQTLVKRILASVFSSPHQAVGKIYQELSTGQGAEPLARQEFERVLQTLARMEWIDISQTSFQKDGQSISYRKVTLGKNSKNIQIGHLSTLEVSFKETALNRTKTSSTLLRKKVKTKKFPEQLPPASTFLVESLKSWRLSEAKKKGIPAFRILSDRVLLSICTEIPRDETRLQNIKGIGPKLIRLYGKDILKVIQQIKS